MNAIKRFTGVCMALALGVSAAHAAPADPTGFWEAENGESRYEIRLCGDGTQLCGTLIWIRPDVTNERNSQYIGRHMVNEAKRRNDRQWTGTINIYGMQAHGVVTQVNDDVIKVHGCALLVFCEDTYVVRISEEAAAGD